MFDDGNIPTATDPLELADFTPRELRLLSEAVAQGVTVATGMLCVAEFVPSAGAFVVRPAVVVNPGALH